MPVSQTSHKDKVKKKTQKEEMLKATSMLTNTRQYGNDICISSMFTVHKTAMKLSQSTPQKMCHPVCEMISTQ